MSSGHRLASAILNGVEILIISNPVNTLDGEFGVDGKKATPAAHNTLATVGLAMTDTSFAYSETSIGPHFSFTESQEATKNFNSDAGIGIGVFGNVYSVTINDGTKVAVKERKPCDQNKALRNPRREIQMLSKLRHRHLVSLIS
ncbi:hypothetical protein ACJRO7_012984 [Eucalyptus globulus]|uniref:Protein kinase domain-containing protein n=1 Tax=Eucalyptus globulus TaxID=34317 RepID=A0ABD3LKJ6_EUCGL